MSHMHTIAHFKLLAPDVQRGLADRLGLSVPEDCAASQGTLANTWLLRAKNAGKLDEMGLAVQLAPQSPRQS
jgi:hypothetical protein